MDPESFSSTGWVLMGVGIFLSAAGGFFYSDVLNCIASPTACSVARGFSSLEFVLIMLIIGGPMVFAGVIFIAAAHVT